MLPRLKPQISYDLVIEVAIVRPGPIQGDMVHPYLRRRDGESEEVDYPRRIRPRRQGRIEGRAQSTLGVPLFQEQAMQIAIAAAKFTPERSRRAAPRHGNLPANGTVHLFRDKFINGMVTRGYDPDFAQNCFSQIEGFGEYGFPESHAASFALLVYVSSWIKCRYPTCSARPFSTASRWVFIAGAARARCAPAQCGNPRRRRELQRLGLHARAERDERHAVRLGFRLIYGLGEEEAEKLIAARGNGYSSIERLASVADVSRFTIERLAEADAFRSLNLDRRAALWAARRLDMIGAKPVYGNVILRWPFRMTREGKRCRC